MNIFNANEILKFAIQIEENGELFYRQAAEKINNENIQKLFSFLAEEEVKHKHMFESIIAALDEYTPYETYPGEYLTYLQTYTNNTIFDMNLLNEEIARIDSALSALDFAIHREWASILYYQEIRNIVPESQHNHIEKIIAQERNHFLKLSLEKEKIS